MFVEPASAVPPNVNLFLSNAISVTMGMTITMRLLR